MTDEQIWKELEFLDIAPGDFLCGYKPEEILASGIEVIKPNNYNYNCLSWAVNEINNCIWPRVNTIDGMDTFVQNFGFKRYKKNNFVYSYKVRKFAVYMRGERVTHAALRIEDGWESKLGIACLIKHKTLDLLTGKIYGEPKHCYYKRLCPFVSKVSGRQVQNSG